ncbi:phosphotransferase family protein [Nocardioides sp. SYSU DS0663]|uniref:phosphotransferase family protein n=1 Tax=Nocardioides sp. SYSU DS0663 TaxID=3416445 RepID=UPI003F4C8043
MSTPDGNPAKPVREEDAFDADAVAAWLREQGTGVERIDEVRQFSGGASNLTYLLVAGDRQLILRRPPAGRKAAGAHDMGREHRIQSALAPVFPYVPAMVGHCTDQSVIGSEFYVMEKVPGLVLRSEFPREVSPAEADALCQRALDVLVSLHSVDVGSVPELAALGRGEGYVGRQVRGWVGRMADARTDDTGDWSDVVAWIEERQPTDVAQVVIHNDFRFDNLVLDDDLSVRAVLDWEMATVGDPLMDLSSTLAYWVEAADDELFQLFRRQPTNAPGMWTRDELVEQYCARMGFDISPDQRLFYEVFGLFRLAVIAQQIWYRYVHQQTTNESHAVLGQVVAYLEARCRRLIAEHPA